MEIRRDGDERPFCLCHGKTGEWEISSEEKLRKGKRAGKRKSGELRMRRA